MIKNMLKNLKKDDNDIEKLKERFKNVTQKADTPSESPHEPMKEIEKPPAPPEELPNLQPAEPMKEPVTPQAPPTESQEKQTEVPSEETQNLQSAEPLKQRLDELQSKAPIIDKPITPPVEKSETTLVEPVSQEQLKEPTQTAQNIDIVDVANLDNNEPEQIKVPVVQKTKTPTKPDQMDEKTQEIVENVEETFQEARMNNIIMQQLKELIEIDNSLNGKIKDVEKKITKEMEEKDKLMNEIKMIQTKLQVIEKSMDQFMTLYEVVTNQFNPFVNNNTPEKAQKEPEPKFNQALDQLIPEINQQQQMPEMTQQQQIPQPIQQPIQEINQPLQTPQPLQQQQIPQPIQQQTPQMSQPQQLPQQQMPQMNQPQKPQQQQMPQMNQLQTPDIPISIEPIHPEFQKVKEELNKEKIRNKVHESHKTLLNNTITQLKSELDTNNADLINHKAEKEELHKKLIAHREELKRHKVDLDKKNAEVEMHKTEKETVKKHLHSLKKEVDGIKYKKQRYKVTDPSQFFHLKNGKTITSLNDLVLFLSDMDDDTFAHHISTDKNDFAIWVNDTLKDEDLAVQMVTVMDRKEMIKIILQHIN